MSMPYNSERRKLLQTVNQFGFALSDITLFLDTHPNDQDALDYYHQMNHMYKKASAEYEHQYGPLTQFAGEDDNVWKWSVQSWPWERGYC
ncbi:MAG: spore coat protein CotJB [Clostridiales bacterium]|nr:spore coat protein CotJB [Clostridiales bacterium]MCD8108854.1 spore coat protein CotJB [Clostridiales bacterium]